MNQNQNIKLFESIQSNMINLGFIPNQKNPFNLQHLRGFIIGLLAIILHFVFFVHVANTIKQYMDSIFMTTVGIAILVSFVSSVLKTKEIFDLINGLEEVINKSEYAYKSQTNRHHFYRIHLSRFYT